MDIIVKNLQPIVAAITPTRGKERGGFLNNLKGMIARQSRPLDMHILVDHAPPTDGRIDLIPRVQLGVEQALAQGATHMLILEDDDYYHPRYVENMLANWDGMADIVGLKNSVYYHLGLNGWFRHNNEWHSSLFTTGFTAKFIQQYQWPMDSTLAFLDMHMWKYALPRTTSRLWPDSRFATGIKHGIGKTGGMGHKMSMSDLQVLDPNFAWLCTFTGKDTIKFYVKLNTWLRAKMYDRILGPRTDAEYDGIKQTVKQWHGVELDDHDFGRNLADLNYTESESG